MYIRQSTIFKALGIGALIAAALMWTTFSWWAAITMSCLPILVAFLSFMLVSMNNKQEHQAQQIARLVKEIKALKTPTSTP